MTLRDQVIKLAHEVPELRKLLVPLLKEAEYDPSHISYPDALSLIWHSYHDKHPGSKRPPPSVKEDAKEMAEQGTGKAPKQQTPWKVPDYSKRSPMFQEEMKDYLESYNLTEPTEEIYDIVDSLDNDEQANYYWHKRKQEESAKKKK